MMTSTLWMAADGIVLTSMTSEALDGCARRPSISTRLRFVPMPRKFKVAAPDELVAPGWMSKAENCVPAGTNWGRSFSTLSMEVLLVVTKLPLSTVMIGLGAVRSLLTMREPVTVISSKRAAGADRILSVCAAANGSRDRQRQTLFCKCFLFPPDIFGEAAGCGLPQHSAAWTHSQAET